ncbi:MAG: hypothetical protein A3I26_00905 [Candidatus Yanofskybacteria bacterium RIFCSPLOWO2_02_FULL_43_10]|uniref:Uncharacterized protein n=1 Tax=Candidatus Yanofskybacteria bacterium RIFCSPLOWO2_12_FULL_43_11b TaxID=1802710 RepID=A0A1F8H9L8_9BACT|nr:MAG: hypothetical protein A2742_03080 [Candidatus Yanofskybacteria bacterium RIFCSPHIGHO2_01_FULL_43_32]OGN11446.1 MAG: hypothetical protein A3C69_01185 [Candidatus Yanofskybacteria bacterium RIFCSPHIGHO2_02_FULL_43_12]OGN17471.1 MAG: hypothetical protein A3E34_02130 [Candidatus Yanofskybacteria bacterium RIFCSPHIGHO2_12_FULL_43_11]OGN24925.1 MAG: hypothetical protein A2923_02850 [Candidatus Yanofskybacteria bacterium RIFCSPLOWO2_01_FULL_43_46]OGN29358.1 MAG: hypothetical protein A3I26_00905
MEIKNKKIIKRKTIRQKKLIKIISANLGNLRPGYRGKTMQEMMLEAGYSRSSSKQQSIIVGGIKVEMDDLVNKMVKVRDLSMQDLDKKIKKASYRELVNSIWILSKLIIMYENRVPKNNTLTEEEKAKIEDLMSRPTLCDECSKQIKNNII